MLGMELACISDETKASILATSGSFGVVVAATGNTANASATSVSRQATIPLTIVRERLAFICSSFLVRDVLIRCSHKRSVLSTIRAAAAGCARRSGLYERRPLVKAMTSKAHRTYAP